MAPKFAWIILVVSLNMVFSQTKANQSTALPGSSAVPSVIKLGIDSLFIEMQRDFDEVIASPTVKSKTTASVNGFFFKTLKEHQPFYSLTRVNAKGIVVNEMIRLVEKTDVKPQNLSKLSWVRRTLVSQKTYSGMVKLEETGRYYLVWAVPILGKDKNGKQIVEGAVSLKIDLWDCFHKYANTTETPFLVRLDKLKLYSNKWKSGTRFKEEPLTIAGIKKISVRYPKEITPIAAPVAAAPIAPPPVVDSTSIKATQDSLKVTQTALVKEKKQKTNIITIGVIILLLLIFALLFITIPLISQRIKMGKLEKEDNIF